MEIRHISVRPRRPPRLDIVVWGAPHRRQHQEVVGQYREMLKAAALRADLKIPLRGMHDLQVVWVDPTSPDHDNLLACLFRAMDKVIVADDGNFSKVTATIMWRK